VKRKKGENPIFSSAAWEIGVREKRIPFVPWKKREEGGRGKEIRCQLQRLKKKGKGVVPNDEKKKGDGTVLSADPRVRGRKGIMENRMERKEESLSLLRPLAGH